MVCAGRVGLFAAATSRLPIRPLAWDAVCAHRENRETPRQERQFSCCFPKGSVASFLLETKMAVL